MFIRKTTRFSPKTISQETSNFPSGHQRQIPRFYNGSKTEERLVRHKQGSEEDQVPLFELEEETFDEEGNSSAYFEKEQAEELAVDCALFYLCNTTFTQYNVDGITCTI